MLPLSCHDPHSTANATCRVPSRVMAEARASLTRTRSLPAHGTVTPGRARSLGSGMVPAEARCVPWTGPRLPCGPQLLRPRFSSQDGQVWHAARKLWSPEEARRVGTLPSEPARRARPSSSASWDRMKTGPSHVPGLPEVHP